MANKSLQDLLKWSLKLSDQEMKEWPSQNFEAMDPERREWLSNTIDSLMKNTDTEVLKRCLDCLYQNSNEDLDDKMLEEKSKALEQIHYLLDVDGNATDLCLMGGLFVVHNYLKSPYSSLRWRAAEVIADATQNKPMSQETFKDLKGISTLIGILDSDDLDMVKVKAVYALSCATRCHEPSLQEFFKCNGVAALVKCIASDFEKLRTKAAFMLINLIREDESIISSISIPDIVKSLIQVLKTKHDNSHEHIAHLLSVILEKSKEAVLVARIPEHGLKKLLNGKIDELKKTDAEAHEEEIIYYQQTLNIFIPKTQT